MAQHLESAVEARFRRAVQRLGGYTMKLVPADKGAPDRLVILPGGVIRLVELKTDRGRRSPAQDYWHDRVADRGVDVDTVYGVAGVDEWAATAAQILAQLPEHLFERAKNVARGPWNEFRG